MVSIVPTHHITNILLPSNSITTTAHYYSSVRS